MTEEKWDLTVTGYEQTIRYVIEENARLYPDAITLEWGDERFTCLQLVDNVTSALRFLTAHGIEPNKRTVLIFQNTPVCIICFLALAWLNAPVIPVEPETTSYNLSSISKATSFGAVLGQRSEIDRLSRSFSQEGYPLIDISDFYLSAKASEIPVNVEPSPIADAFLYHYTSGSTGGPKAALHSQDNLVKGGLVYKQSFHFNMEDRILTVAPLSHSFGMLGGLMASLVSAGRLVLMQQFAPRRILKILSEKKITVLIAPPMAYDLLTRITFDLSLDLSDLRFCISSGASLSPRTIKGFERRYGRTISQVYGSTEMGAITGQYPRDEPWPEASVGSALAGVRLRIVDDADDDLPPNVTGNILVRTPSMFYGYYGRREAVVDVFRGDWYITGDIGRLDSEGNLYIEGRKETFINVGGRKVNPIEVEDVLVSHPRVDEALVYGEEAEIGGEQVEAIVVLCGSASENELIQFCRERLAFYKVPHHIKFAKVIPKTNLGKVRRTLSSRRHGK